MLTRVKGEGYSIEQIRAMIESAQRRGNKELASMLQTCLNIRLGLGGKYAK